MRKILGIGVFILSLAFAALILIGNFVMNFIGFMICVITDGGR